MVNRGRYAVPIVSDSAQDESSSTRRLIRTIWNRTWRTAGVILLVVVVLGLAEFAISESKREFRVSGVKQSRVCHPPEETIRDPGTWTPITIFNLALVVIGFGQASLFFWQLGFLRAANDTARRAADASKTAAEAALAALSRPWLAIEGVTHNKLDWIGGAPYLIASFRVRNYGNAPAFIVSLKAILFQTLSPSQRFALAGVLIPADYQELPTPDDIQTFIDVMHSELCVSLDNWTPAFTGGPIGISIGTPSQQFYCRQLPIRPPDLTGIDVHANLILLGQLCYHGPDEQIWKLNFCYGGGKSGRFQQMYGSPYNAKARND